MDPRNFGKIVSNNELAIASLQILTDEEIIKFEKVIELKKSISANKVEFDEKRDRLKKLVPEYEKINEEYWLRGAGWNVEHLKVAKTKLKIESAELSEILKKPNEDLANLVSEVSLEKIDDRNLKFYEDYKANFEKYTKIVGMYSVFDVELDQKINSYLITPDWVSKVLTLDKMELVSESSGFGQWCINRIVGEDFFHTNNSQKPQSIRVIKTRLISTKELNNLIYKLNVHLISPPTHDSQGNPLTKGPNHLSAPVPLGGGGERRAQQLNTWS